MNRPFSLNAMAIATCLGLGKDANAARLFVGSREGIREAEGFLACSIVPLGQLPYRLPPLPASLAEFDSRNNRLIAALLDEMSEPLASALQRYGRNRVAVVLGTSTSGIAEGEEAIAHHIRTGAWPTSFCYSQQETGSSADFVTRMLGLTGPAYVVATACSSSAKVFASARRLIRLGLADAAIVGGVDTLCRMTVSGFASLEALSARPCNPFSANRDGITIGEGGALFLLEPGVGEIQLLGVGEGSDAHHVSAPDPEGNGAREAMACALADAGLTPAEISYVNLHGTATALNDAMESKAVHALFGARVPCSSTKAMTGHTLGAAGAVEAAFLWLTLSSRWNPERRIPPQLWDGVPDSTLPALALADCDARLPTSDRITALSNSFAFGGSNCAVVLGTGDTP